MYCNYCGNEVKDDAVFCDKCGKSLIQDTIVHEATDAHKETSKSKKKIHVRYIVLAVAVIIVGIIVAFANMGDSIDETISLVQNGYLGEYTDLTVKQVLDGFYGLMYAQSVWDGGITDSGNTLVEVKYYNETEKEDGVTIQFTMLDDDCFKITAFVDPNEPIEKATDLLVKLNCLYIMAYGEAHQEVLYDSQLEADMILRLSKISASAALYGASSNYEGNRAEIHKIAGDDMLDVNVVMLLDNYDLLGVYDYIADAPSELQENNPKSPEFSDQDDAEFMLYTVMNDIQDFFMADTGEIVGIYDITNIAGNQFDCPLQPTSYAYIDLDRDGIQEVIIELTNRVDGWRLVLRYQDDQVYGYGFNFRAMKSISTDGRIMASSGASDSEVYTLTFDCNDVYKEVNTRADKDTVWLDINWFDFETDELLVCG